MRPFTTSIHRRVLPALSLAGLAGLAGLAAIAACSGQVEVTPTSSSAGAGGSTSSSAASTSATTTSSGGDPLGPLVCPPGDGAIVVGSAYDQATVSVLNDGAWIEGAASFPGATFTAAYVDVYDRLSAFWIKSEAGDDSAGYLATHDGASFDTHEVTEWTPRSYAPIFSLGTFAMAGRDDQGLTTAVYDADAMNWYPWATAKFDATSGVALAMSADIVFIGTNASQLCDLRFIAGDSFGPTSCHPELEVFLGSDIPTPPPQLVALPNGDAVAVYATSHVNLTAAVLHEGKWSAPVTTTSPQTLLSLAVTVAPSGDVLVGLSGGAYQFHVLRFSPGAGWGAPILIDAEAQVPPQRIAAAPGICGDDALFAYVTSETNDEPHGEIRVARIRGNTTSTTKVGGLANAVPAQVSIATRSFNAPL